MSDRDPAAVTPSSSPLQTATTQLAEIASPNLTNDADQRKVFTLGSQCCALVDRIAEMDPKGPDGEGWQQCIFCGVNAETAEPEHKPDCVWLAARHLREGTTP